MDENGEEVEIVRTVHPNDIDGAIVLHNGGN